MKGNVLQMSIVLDHRDAYSPYTVGLGDYLKFDHYMCLVKKFLIEDDVVIVQDIKGHYFNLSKRNAKMIFPRELTLHEIKKQIEFISSVKYLPRLQHRVFEAFTIAVKKSTIDERSNLFPNKSIIDIICQYSDKFNIN